jgi:uncharacterized protein (TIGR01777 family)
MASSIDRVFERTVELPVSAAQAFAWHERPGALDRLIPPWERVRVARASGGLAAGAQVELVTWLGPLRLRWLAEHTAYAPPEFFRDVQRSGPFARWEHTHRFENLPLAAGEGGSIGTRSVSEGEVQPALAHASGYHARCRLTDHIDYRLPGGALGRWLGSKLVAEKLKQMFAYRHQTTADDLAAHATWKEKPPMKILISGASGLVGSQLVPFLTTGGHQVTKLVRKSPGSGEAQWDGKSQIDAAAVAAADAVIHLAGDNIAEGRWTAAKKQKIRDSRVEGTRLIAETIAKSSPRPKVLVCASAIGYYGNRGDEILTEQSAPGDGFLPDVCKAWEEAAQAARDAGVRVVNLRIGVVLTPKGGALAKMLFPFKTGGGGKVGSGKQYWSWIALDDVIGVIHHALMNDALTGPVNTVAPQPVTNYDFTKTLGRVLHRPTILPLPGFAARLLLGQMADDLLLASQRVVPQRLKESGYQFRYPELEVALRSALGKRE